MRLTRQIALALAFLLAATPSFSQELLGFDRSSFGSVVLSRNQSAGADIQLELSVGSYNNESIQNYSDDSVFAKMGRSVGRLDILTDQGIFPCTAFIVSKSHILTNYHCVPGILDNEQAGATRIDAVQFVAGYVQQGVEDGTKTYIVSPTPVEANQELDYAILEVIGNPSATYGMLALANRQPKDRDPYWVIGHPMGEAQRISREKCRANTPALSDNRLLHTCDTLPGNSGSPVIDASLQQVIGLHHAGSRKDSVNFAIPMALILERSKVLKPHAGGTGNGQNGNGQNSGGGWGQPNDNSGGTQVAGNDNTDFCDELYSEAKAYSACFAYQVYAESCKSHTYVRFAQAYIQANCAEVPEPPQPKPEDDVTYNPPKPSGPLRPWCTSNRLNATEAAICASPYLAGLDEEMTQLYWQRDASSINASQVNWLKNQRNACGSNESCIANAYNQRIAFLKTPTTTPVAKPGSYTLPSSRCYIVVASRPSVAEAKQFIHSGLQDTSGVRIFHSENGYYGITVATVNKSEANYYLNNWKSQNRIPQDSYCASGRNFVTEIAWQGGGTTHTPTPSTRTLWVDNNNGGGLNLRSGPGTGYPIVDEMPAGMKVTEQSRQGNWSQLLLPTGTRGWAHNGYLTTSKPYVRQCWANVVNVGHISTYNTNTGAGFLSVRSKPTTKSGSRISELYRGDRVKVVAQRNGWARVQCVSGQCQNPYRGTAGAIGWAYGKYLSIRCE